MSKVTSKLQVTIPKAIAQRFDIKPGDEIDWVPAGEGLRVVVASHRITRGDLTERLRRFDEATERQRHREGGRGRRKARQAGDRGWRRDALYTRGSPR